MVSSLFSIIDFCFSKACFCFCRARIYKELFICRLAIDFDLPVAVAFYTARRSEFRKEGKKKRKGKNSGRRGGSRHVSVPLLCNCYVVC